MYRPDPHPDPYANQYPPPPPLAPEHHSTGYIPPSMPTPSPYPPPPQPSAIYPPEGIHPTPGATMVDRQEIASAGHYSGYNSSSFHSVPIPNESNTRYGQQQQQQQQQQPAIDPQAVTMEEYRTAEQHEQYYNHNYGHDNYYKDYRDEPDHTSSHTPMVQPPPLLQQQQQQHPSSSIQLEDTDSYKPTLQKKEKKQPYNHKKYTTAGPIYAPEDEAEGYRPKYYDHDERRNNSGCNCCCYNPAMTCCSCFCFLISLGFLAAGIALIIAAKVIGDKCNTQCGDVVDKAATYGVNAQPCDAICGKVVHDGMFYGGIVVAGLAAIAAIWKIFMWMCAAGSRR